METINNETQTAPKITIIRRNEYCILVNGKVVMESMDDNSWISDERLTNEEWGALIEYLRSK